MAHVGRLVNSATSIAARLCQRGARRATSQFCYEHRSPSLPAWVAALGPRMEGHPRCGDVNNTRLRRGSKAISKPDAPLSPSPLILGARWPRPPREAAPEPRNTRRLGWCRRAGAARPGAGRRTEQDPRRRAGRRRQTGPGNGRTMPRTATSRPSRGAAGGCRGSSPPPAASSAATRADPRLHGSSSTQAPDHARVPADG